MLTPYKGAFQKVAGGAARPLLAVGLTPNGITLLSLSLTLGICVLFSINQNPAQFGVLMIAAGLLDAVDGAAARMSGQVTKFGGYLDALCDRIAEAAGSFAVAWVSGEWVLCFLFFAGSCSISYAKARAAVETPVDNNEWPDLMERAERNLAFALILIAWGLFPDVKLRGESLLFWGLVLLLVPLYYTVLQRVRRARRLMLR